MFILPQIAQITQRNAAGCIITQRKTGCLRLKQLLLFCCFGFRLRKSARSAGDFVVHLCGLIEYAYVNILPQITQITQRNAASCIITQRKTDSVRLLRFCCLSAIISEICGRHWGFI